MSEVSKQHFTLPPEQQAIRDKCFHPSGTFVAFPIEDVETSIPARFEKIVGIYPDRIAIRTRARHLTYDELNRRANRLAHELLARRGNVSEPVALFLGRWDTLVVGHLAAIKSGKFSLALDPGSEIERTTHLLHDSRAEVVIVDDETIKSIHGLVAERCVVIHLDDLSSSLSEDNPQIQVLPEAYSYVRYTSGSTGSAKGATKSHRHVLKAVMDFVNHFHLCADDSVTLLGFASIGKHLLIALLTGARFCPYDVRNEGIIHLDDWLLQERISVFYSFPTAFRYFVRSLSDSAVFPQLRLIEFEGEPVYRRDFDMLKKHVSSDCFLVNTLSSAETGTVSLYFLDMKSVINSDRVPVGYPVEGVEILILDDAGLPLGIDQVGEVAVRSSFLSGGYWQKPDATSQKFIPQAGDGSSFMYLTGDLGSLSRDGCLTLLGRKDFQVKIRSFRVDVTEVETVLNQHDEIRSVAVTGRDDQIGNKRLVAYVVPRGRPEPMVAALKLFLRDKLPEYMIPTEFVFLDELPLMSTGKIDRRALPDPNNQRPDCRLAIVEPRTPIEKTLADIWAEVLLVPKVGLHDNFFDLGGHSLAASQVVARINTSFQIDLPLRRLFETPTIPGLADAVQASMAIERDSHSARSIVPIPRNNTIPLSFAQERLWFLDRLNPDSPTYNVPAAFRLSGELNLNALEQSLNEVVRRHEVLRTVFATINGNLVQKILPSLVIALTPIDLSQQPENDQELALQSLLENEALRPFDLSRGPLIRAQLLRLSPLDHVLALNLHHIVSDGWSMGVLFGEISALYRAYRAGQPNPLPQLPIQYADYSVWQRAWLQGETLDHQLSYWKTRLDSLSTLQLPTDHPRPAMQTYHGSRRSVELSANLYQALKGLSRREGVTLFMTLLAAFQTLLCRYCGQQDIAVGTPIAGRTRQEIEGLIGFFVNTLVLRSDLSNNPSFRQLLARVRQGALDAYDHQEVPFEKLVEELNPDRSLTASPLFQVMFILQNANDPSLQLEGLTTIPHHTPSNIAKFDLSLTVSETDCALRASLNYNTDLFDSSTIERMLGHFQTLLEGILANPDQLIGELPILTEPEKHQLLVKWNDTKADYPNDKCIHQAFEQQVEKTPEAVALVFEDTQISYKDLNARANQLAHYLQKLGVGPEVPVGICLERSIEMIIGLLAILKAGGAYVPLDPSYPQDRLALMLANSSSAVVLTQQSFTDMFSNIGTKLVYIETDQDKISAENDTNLSVTISPDNLAYVLYTSGSTGAPKGVAVKHRNTLAFLSWALSAFAPEDFRGVLAATSISFDLSVFEIFATLACGGKIVLVQNALALAQSRNAGEVTLINTVPSAITELVKLRAIPPSVRVINLAGEPLHKALVQQIYESCSVETVNDLYGPTECTTYSTWTCRRPDGPQTIGRPIANTKIYILDSHLTPVPIGVPGEIYIGGAGVVRGYLNRPELTQEKFIANPLGSEPGARLYKTGDLARYLPDGNIEFLGRIDNQVKIRGYRIEPGEVEAVLAQHPAIQQAVVIVREDTPEDKRLVAYTIANKGFAPSANDLRSYLQHKLPEYMIPSAFVFLDSLPLNPNGKLDRKALPAPDQTRLELEEMYSPPRTPVEESLAQIWADVLKLDQIGIHDNFFDLGGHSLLATQVVSRVNHSFQIELRLRSLFELPTIAGLADSIQGRVGIEHDSPPVQRIVPIPLRQVIPLSFAQERLWFLDQLDPDRPTYNVPAAFRLAGDLNLNALEQSLNEVVRRHECLRTVFVTVDDNPVQKILPSLVIALTPIDLSDHPENDRESALNSLIKQEAERPFDLSHGPLIRACLWRLAPHDHLLALNLHHIISDGWSMSVLFGELSALYQGYCAARPASLPELPVQYADYALWQRDWLQGENLDIQLAYWRKQLDSLSTLQLPTDHPRPAVQTYRGASRSLELSTQLSQAIKGLGRREGVTLFMTLLAAFQTLLSRCCGQSDIAVGTPIAGRVRQEIEGLIGFFVNTLVLRSDLSDNPTFKELLRQIRETTLAAYTHQDLPFEKLVEELHPERNPSISPLFQVMFILQNNADQPLEFERLTVSPIRTGNQVAKFDLTLTMSERQGTLQASFNYNTDLFDARTIERMLGHFQTLLEGIVATPEQPISELPLLTEAEKHQLLVEWNNTKTDYPKDKCIYTLFEEQVEKSPDAIAVVFEEQRLTYRELNQRANQLAHYLITEGVRSGTAVGIYLDRSIELAVALLAVLKAGGVYVPIDPTYPIERVKFILQDVQASFVVSTQALASQLSLIGARTIILDTELQRLDSNDSPNPHNIVGSQSPAYILYTSGSTGTPKGVVMRHRPLNNLISWQVSRFGQALPARTLQFAPLGFDVSLQEMFSTWCSGGSLYFIHNDLRQDGSSLLKYFDKQSIERIFLPFVALQHFAEIAVNENCIPQSLREIVTAGEQLRLTKPLRQLLDKLEHCRLHNQYGPTESHVVTEYTLNAPCRQESDLPPIGRPIANTQIYLLDPQLNLVPIGVTGEIYIGGDGVAQGYFNRTELTQEKFIANPFSNDPTNRLYKTGDLARYLPDGNIEFLGRIDNQVKIRGFRIELGEVEAILARHPSIQQAVLLAREETPGDKRLVAYVVAAEGSTPSVHDLRSYLQHKLPDYMVPSTFVFLDSLPLTPNGKLDRRALPAPDQNRPELEDAFAAPTTPVEEILANIWCTVLKLDKVGIHDNFFDLGGHSLLATQVVSRIRSNFSIDLPLRDFFVGPTIAAISQRIESQRTNNKTAHQESIFRVEREKFKA